VEYSNTHISNQKKPMRNKYNGGANINNNSKATPALSVALATNADAIRRSSSFKYKGVPYRIPFGCTYYGEGIDSSNHSQNTPTIINAKIGSRKKRMTSMIKTFTNWGNNKTSSKEYLESNYQCKKSSCKKSYLNSSQLPNIEANQKQFNADECGSTEDAYIKYIKSKKKCKEAETGYLTKLRSFKGKNMDSSQLASARRRSKDNSNEVVETQSFTMNGINFEVHSRSGASPTESLKNFDSQISQGMDLMFYDFNGSAQRKASESPRPHEYKQSTRKNHNDSEIIKVYQNRTTEKFYKKAVRDIKRDANNNTKSTHDATAERASEHSPQRLHNEEDYASQEDNNVFEDSRSCKKRKSPPPLAPVTNNGILYPSFNNVKNSP
jgi:hypothetical protein